MRARTTLPPSSTGLVPRRGTSLVPAHPRDERTAHGYLRLAGHVLLEAERHAFRTLGVLSAHAGEGKTTAAINLAACLGRARGREGRVLLVDGDARGRTLTRMLCGQATVEHDEPMLAATAFDGVDLLTAPAPSESPRIHAPRAWVEMLQDLAGRYPQVVVDCPAILADPEGGVLRECVEALVFVVEVGRTTTKAIEAAATGVGRRVIGVILNGAEDGAATERGEPRNRP